MKNTEQNNKLLAEFMGYQQENKLVYAGMYTSPKRQLVFDIKGNKYSAKNLKFHKNWNWLMEVIEKIESLANDKKVIDWSRQSKTIFDFKLTESKIEAVYNACIEFVKWYLENSAKEN